MCSLGVGMQAESTKLCELKVTIQEREKGTYVCYAFKLGSPITRFTAEESLSRSHKDNLIKTGGGTMVGCQDREESALRPTLRGPRSHERLCTN